MSKRPEDPEYTAKPDPELEAVKEAEQGLSHETRQDEAEALKIEAAQDGIKDVDREAKIERLESAGDMVEENRPAIKKGALADGNWHSDRGKPKPAKTEKAWYRLSLRRQDIELQKISGTYRPRRGDPHSKSRKPDRPEDRVIQSGPLYEAHESPKVRRNDAMASGILEADESKKPQPPKPKPPALPAVMGYCRECHKAIPRGMRTDAKFCSEAHSKAFRRREMAKEIANRALFKDHQPTPGPELPFYYPQPAPEQTPPMTASYAARSGRLDEYLAARQNGLVRDNPANTKQIQ